jgi:MoxR-like ATPase
MITPVQRGKTMADIEDDGGRLFEECEKHLGNLRDNLRKVIRGKDDAIDTMCVGLLARGCILIEDVPGVGKTTLAKALARSLDAEFNRIQFTPDLLPADILGSSIYSPADGSFHFRKGPIFCNVLLADEINRASPRTQSALLEAMSEGQATIEGVCHPLPAPFMVLATENPVEFHGTYPLPEAQLDRFTMMLSIGYPEADVESEILFAQKNEHPLTNLGSVLTLEEIRSIQHTTTNVQVSESVAEYIVALVQHTRTDARLKLGVSPRGSLMLFRASQARAVLKGRDYVLPDDVQAMAVPVLAHRLILNSKSKYSGVQKQDIVCELLAQIKVPK